MNTLLALLLALTLCGSGHTTVAHAGTRTGYCVSGMILLKGKKQGPVLLQLVSKQEFVDPAPPRYKLTLSVSTTARQQGKVPFRFTGIPSGRYALQAFQDENNNGRLDFRLFSPKEPWGSYHPARPAFRGPKFEELAFPIQTNLSGIQVELY